MTPTANSLPMMTSVQRFAAMAEARPEMLEKCRKLCARPSADVLMAMKAAHFHNATIYLKKITDPDHLLLFNYAEYSGNNYKADIIKLAAHKAYAQWRKDCDACLVAAKNSTTPFWMELEQLFYTAGAADVVPVPAKYERIGMITGLKPEKEMEYRALHTATWSGVLKSIKDGNVRNFSINLGEVGCKLYLFSYMEYVGADRDADEAKGKALPINLCWWKLTDACQEPLPEAAARKQIWSGMDEIYHHE